MYAIFKNGGRQYRAEKGVTLELDRQGPDEGAKIEFSDVVLYHDGQKAEIGKPLVKGAKVRTVIDLSTIQLRNDFNRDQRSEVLGLRIVLAPELH